MTFLQPAFLWGLLAIAIPVLIHLWHQKRGQPLPWAAMQWLHEASEQQQRGLKFDDLLLLVVRCLVIALLSVLLARPVWKSSSDTKIAQAVHVAASDSLVRSTFRFELDRARQAGEPIISLPAATPANPLQIQTVLDSIRQPGLTVHLYIRNDASLADVPHISVPEQFSLLTATASQPVKQPVSAATQKPFEGIKSPLNVRIDYQNPLERQTVTAALRALAGVYGLNLNLVNASSPSTEPDWILTNQLSSNLNPSTLYTISGAHGASAKQQMAQIAPNVVFVDDTLTTQTSELVATGRLPELLGNHLLTFYKRNPTLSSLTQQEMAGLFKRYSAINTASTVSIDRTKEQNWILLALLIMIGLERWLALRK